MLHVNANKQLSMISHNSQNPSGKKNNSDLTVDHTYMPLNGSIVMKICMFKEQITNIAVNPFF